MKNRRDISDIELDELFKKASQKVNPEFEESSWLDLESKLDNANIEPQVGIFNTTNLLVLLGIFIVAGLVFTRYTWNNNELKIDKTEIAQDNTSETKNKDEKSGFAINATETNSQSTSIGQKAASEQEFTPKAQHIGKSELINNNGLVSENRTPSTFEKNFSKKDSPSASRNANSKMTGKKNGNFEVTQRKKESSGFKSKTKTKSVSTSTLQSDVLNKDLSKGGINEEKSSKISAESLKIIQITPYAIGNFVTLGLPFQKPHVEKIEAEQKVRKQNKLYLSAGISPDFSKVLENSFLKMGYNWSAQLEYHFNDRWSVHSGIIISEKFYGSGVDGMHWPNNWGAMPKEMKGMEGSCNVIDIPLNFRYNLKYNDRSKMYLVGGVSSFIMMNEQYEYIYPEGFNSEGMKTSWSINESGVLAAGMANFAIGYERKIGNILSVQLEPFVKIPIRDFGFSQVKLATTGVFLTGKVRIK